MSRLIVNPGTPQAWEILLKPGTNSLGRGDANDFTINDASVSGAHCEIVVGEGAAALKDLGSTNGTYIAGTRVQEHQLEDGKGLRLGNVEMVYYAAASPVAAAAAPPPVRVAMRVATPVAVPVAAVGAPSVAVSGTDAAPLILTGIRHCKYHPQSIARFLCAKCDRTYCDLCIQMMDVGGATARTCRKCGGEVTPVRFRAAPTKSFYAKLPGAFLYPFKGAGILSLLCGTVALMAVNFVSGGILGVVFQVCLYGFVFLFMQNIILTTTSDENDELAFPEASGLVGAAFQLAGTVIMSFWIAIGLNIARLCGVDIPAAAIMGAVILGGIYFPMALLAVAMKDSIAAANPLVVVPAMLKAPAKYAVTVALLLGVFGFRQAGDLISGGAGRLALTTRNQNTFILAIGFRVVWTFVSIYLLCVTMRLLGLFYNGSKRELGWFKF